MAWPGEAMVRASGVDRSERDLPGKNGKSLEWLRLTWKGAKGFLHIPVRTILAVSPSFHSFLLCHHIPLPTFCSFLVVL